MRYRGHLGRNGSGLPTVHRAADVAACSTVRRSRRPPGRLPALGPKALAWRGSLAFAPACRRYTVRPASSSQRSPVGPGPGARHARERLDRRAGRRLVKVLSTATRVRATGDGRLTAECRSCRVHLEQLPGADVERALAAFDQAHLERAVHPPHAAMGPALRAPPWRPEAASTKHTTAASGRSPVPPGPAAPSRGSAPAPPLKTSTRDAHQQRQGRGHIGRHGDARATTLR